MYVCRLCAVKALFVRFFRPEFVKVLVESLNMKLSCLPENHGSIAEVRMGLGKVDYHRGAYTAAQESFAAALEVLEKSCEDNVERAYCHFWAGKAFFEGKKAEQAYPTDPQATDGIWARLKAPAGHPRCRSSPVGRWRPSTLRRLD